MSNTSIYNNQDVTTDSTYESYNNLIFSGDVRILSKFIQRTKFYELTKNLIGDIVECGVFRGSGMGVFLNLIKMNEPISQTKVIGFDFFDTKIALEQFENTDTDFMNKVLDRVDPNELNLQSVKNNLERLGAIYDKNFLLIQGNINLTSKDFALKNPGFRIKILYLDLDVGDATYTTLCNLWDKIVVGGIVILDEYSYHIYTESDGVDRFLREKKLHVRLINTGIYSPTAYFIKEHL